MANSLPTAVIMARSTTGSYALSERLAAREVAARFALKRNVCFEMFMCITLFRMFSSAIPGDGPTASSDKVLYVTPLRKAPKLDLDVCSVCDFQHRGCVEYLIV